MIESVVRFVRGLMSDCSKCVHIGIYESLDGDYIPKCTLLTDGACRDALTTKGAKVLGLCEFEEAKND